MALWCKTTRWCISFNPRSHEGSDHSSDRIFPCLSMFQSTLPRGERPIHQIGNCRFYQCFNPRSPRGERLYDVYIVDITIVTSSFFANVTITTYVQLIFWCWYCVTHYKLVTANSLENMLHYTFAPYHIISLLHHLLYRLFPFPKLQLVCCRFGSNGKNGHYLMMT